MKFRLLLLGLSLLMWRASKNNPEFRKKLEGKELTFDICSDDGVRRGFTVQDQKVTSRSRRSREPEFVLCFKTANDGFSTLTSDKPQLAFMKGIQDKIIRVEGNAMSLMWFQSLVVLAIPSKKKKKKDD